MGRYILWRTPLIFAFLFLGFSISLVGTPLHRSLALAELEIAWDAQPSRRVPAAKKVWTEEIQWAIDNREEITLWIEKWSTRAGLSKILQSHNRVTEFQNEVDTLLRMAHIPWEMQAIPIVESNWRMDAVSSSGATGPWQFIETSGRGRGLIIDAWRDERRDYWRSTEAAADELNFSYRLFKDWVLSIAAYNAGPTRIRTLRDAESLNTFWEMLDAGIIPPETRNYVPQVIAVAYIQAHAGRLGLPISWETAKDWSRITMEQSIQLIQLAEITGLKMSEVLKAHPELQHPVTPPPTHKYMIKVPKDMVEATKVWMDILKTSNAPLRFWRYTVKSGDTLSGIAKTYDVAMNDLIRYNDHIRSGYLRIGERLYLPGREIVPEGVDSEDIPDWKGRYKVKKGDTLWSISRKFRISPEKLAEANHRTLTAILRMGSTLKVPEEEL